MAKPLFLEDCYLKEFDAVVTFSDENPEFILLDQTAFYAESGGQPGDTGKFVLENGEEVKVIRTKKEGGHARHYVEKQIPVNTKVHGVIDWEPRYSYMKMHTAQHLLSAVILDKYGAETAGNQIHTDKSRIDFRPITWGDEIQSYATEKFNQAVEQGLPVVFKTVSREEMMEMVDERRRKLFERLPSFIKEIRLVIIGEKVDIVPCAGTHVKNTDEIGKINITQTISKGKDTVRVVFTLGQ